MIRDLKKTFTECLENLSMTFVKVHLKAMLYVLRNAKFTGSIKPDDEGGYSLNLKPSIDDGSEKADKFPEINRNPGMPPTKSSTNGYSSE